MPVIMANTATDMQDLSWETVLLRARAFAHNIHRQERDDADWPYMSHIARVVNEVAELHDPEITTVAILHDTLEKATDKEQARRVLKLLVPEPVFAAVLTLTRQKSDDYVRDHLARVLLFGRTAVAVKMAEVSDNLNLQRMKARVARFEGEEASAIQAFWNQEEQYKQALELLTSEWLRRYA